MTAVAKVSKAGVYDMDIDIYHSQKACVGPSISSTGMRMILRECPKKFFATSDLNPNAFPPKDSKAFNFGRAAHCLMLGEPEFASKFVVSPFENFLTKEAKLWRDKQTKQIVRIDDMATVHLMVEAQRVSPDCARAFKDGEPEKCLIWQDGETGVWLKSRPDWLPHKPDKRLISEYKTTETLKPSILSSAAFTYGYEMQAALILDAVNIVMEVEPQGVVFIVQEKDPPYMVEARLFTPEQIDFGRLQIRKALRIFADCLETGIWPGYSDGPRYFDTPFWVA